MTATLRIFTTEKTFTQSFTPSVSVFPLWNQQVTGEGLQAGKPMSRQGDGADEVQTLLALSLPVASSSSLSISCKLSSVFWWLFI
jgi:hypothetical protein